MNLPDVSKSMQRTPSRALSVGGGGLAKLVLLAGGSKTHQHANHKPDGATVEVVAEGRREALADMLALLGEGPPGARVDEVEAEWSAARSEATTFQVRP